MSADTSDQRRIGIYRRKLAAARDTFVRIDGDKRKSSTEKATALRAYEEAIERIDDQFVNGTGGW